MATFTTANYQQNRPVHCQGFSVIRSNFVKLLNKLPYSVYRSLIGDFVPVLMLHRTRTSFSPDGYDLNHLHRCLSYLKKANYNTISLEYLVNMARQRTRVPPKSIVFTVDDGFRDNIVDTAAVFSEYDIPLTCFAITDFVERKLWPWDDKVKFALMNSEIESCELRFPDDSIVALERQHGSLLHYKSYLRDILKRQPQSEIYEWLEHSFFPALEVDVPSKPPEAFAPASWNEINNFVKRGHCIAPHSQTHRILSMLNDDEASTEIAQSYAVLKKNVASVSPVFAYPTGREGDFAERDEKLCSELGLLGAVSSTPGHWSTKSGLYRIPRLSLPDNFDTFMQYAGAIEAIRGKMK